jgi:DNA polymerase-3 subunit alpha
LAWLKGFYRKPRVNHQQLIDHRDGIFFTSCCCNSEIARAFLDKGEEAADQMLEKYMKMFPGHFFLEIMLIDFHKQKPYDAYVLRAKEKYNLPIIVTLDSHYVNKEDSFLQRCMLMIKTQTTIKDALLKKDAGEDVFELQDSELYMKSEQELDQKYIEVPDESKYIEDDPYSRMAYSEIIPYEIYCEAKRTTVEICRKAAGVEIDRSIKLPEIPDADEKLEDELAKGFKKRRLIEKPNKLEYILRLQEEKDMIQKKGFSSYFLIQKRMTDEARRICPQILGWGDGSEALGWGRGSAVSSLACYCLGITNVDPIRHGLLFSRFLNDARGGRQLRTRFRSDPISHIVNGEEDV